VIDRLSRAFGVRRELIDSGAALPNPAHLPIPHRNGTEGTRPMIEALTMPAVLLALAISGALALYGIIRQ